MRLTASFCAPAPSILTRTQQYIHGYKTPCFAPLWPVLLHDDSAAKGAAPPTRSQHDARSALKLPPSNVVATSNCETIVGCAHSFLGTLSYPYFRVLIPFPGPTVLLSLVHTCSRPQQLAEHTQARHVAKTRCFFTHAGRLRKSTESMRRGSLGSGDLHHHHHPLHKSSGKHQIRKVR